MPGHSKRVAIIGGGITGLAAAYRLLEHRKETGEQIEVTLLEASSRVGGVLKISRRDGFLIESGADSFISEKPAAIELATRLGIVARLIETNEQHRRSFIVRRGRLAPVPDGFQLMAPARFWPFVTSNIFSWHGKARMALDVVIPRRRIQNGSDDESLADFVRRRLGREAFERMAQPMIGGIYTADPEKLSLRATLPRFLEMERQHGSLIRAMWKQRRGRSPRGPQYRDRGLPARNERPQSGVSGARYSLFLSFDEGMQVLVDELVARLRDVIQLHTKVETLSFDDERKQWKLRLSNQTEIEADSVCLAVPAYAAASLLAETDGELARLLNQISYASTATINLAYRRADVPHRLDGFGFVVPFIEKRSLLACTFSSVKFPGRAPDGQVLLRAFVGGALQSQLFELDEDEMLERMRTDLRDLLGITTAPRFASIEKWHRSMPQYHVGHLELVRQIQSRVETLSGLHLAGNAYSGASVPDCIRSGEGVADLLVQ